MTMDADRLVGHAVPVDDLDRWTTLLGELTSEDRLVMDRTVHISFVSVPGRLGATAAQVLEPHTGCVNQAPEPQWNA